MCSTSRAGVHPLLVVWFEPVLEAHLSGADKLRAAKRKSNVLLPGGAEIFRSRPSRSSIMWETPEIPLIRSNLPSRKQ